MSRRNRQRRVDNPPPPPPAHAPRRRRAAIDGVELSPLAGSRRSALMSRRHRRRQACASSPAWGAPHRCRSAVNGVELSPLAGKRRSAPTPRHHRQSRAEPAGRRTALCAGERAQLDVFDCGATSVWSAAIRRAGTCLTASIAARRRRRAPCAGEGEAQLDAVDCGATSARSAVRRRAGSARRSRWRRDISAKCREPASGLSSTPSIAARRRRGAPCTSERAQLDAVDGGATSARSAVSRRAGSARRRRLRRDVGAELGARSR